MIVTTNTNEVIVHEKKQYQNDISNDNYIRLYVSGELFAEPFIHYFPSGKSVCIFRIGVRTNQNQRSCNGEEFSQIYCAAYNDLGREIFKRFNLGDSISVEGHLKFYKTNGDETYDLIVTAFHKAVDRRQGSGRFWEPL